jgi:hypothetical protein
MRRVLHVNNWHVSLTTFKDDGAAVRTELVPGIRYQFHDCPADLVVRLQSTRAGNNAWWAAGSVALKALNESPYNPMLRARVSVFEWKPPASKDNTNRFCYDYPSNEELESAHHGQYVVQGGSLVLNWFAIVTEPIPDPLREKIKNLIRDIFESEWTLHARSQGHLQVFPVFGHDDKVNDLLEDLPDGGSGYKALYNHHIYCVWRWAWRVIDGTAYAVFVPAHGEVIVTSHDHESEYLHIQSPARIFLARHPVPRPERGVD